MAYYIDEYEHKGKITDEDMVILQNACNVINKIHHDWFRSDPDCCDDSEGYNELGGILNSFDYALRIKPSKDINWDIYKAPTKDGKRTYVKILNNAEKEIANFNLEGGYVMDYGIRGCEVPGHLSTVDSRGNIEYSVVLKAPIDAINAISTETLLGELGKRCKG